MPLNYQFKVWSATGTYLRTVPRDATAMLSTGLRMRLSPDADCIEANFNARQSLLGLTSLQTVQVRYSNLASPTESDWIPVFYGEVRIGGNIFDYKGESVTLRGLSRRFAEVTLPAGSYAQADAAVIARQAVQDVIASGQLGSPALVTYDASLIPNMGFNYKVTATNQQLLSALLDDIVKQALAQLGVVLVYGVRPDGKFFMHEPRTDSQDIAYGTNLLDFSPKEPVAETPCTAVLWFLDRRPDGTYYTHVSESPAAAQYGRRIKPISLDLTKVQVWQTVAGTYKLYEKLPAASGSPPNPYTLVSPQPSFNTALLTDKVLSQTDGLGGSLSQQFTSGGHPVLLGFVPSVTPQRYVLSGLSPDANLFAGLMTDGSGLIPSNLWNVYANKAAQLTAVLDPTLVAAPPNSAYLAATDQNSSTASTSITISAAEMRGERINTELLDRLAGYYYNLPGVAPADVRASTFIPPLSLTGKVHVPAFTSGSFVVADYAQNVSAWEYELTAAGGMQTVALAGQADDPAKLAAASLIKRSDNNSVIEAITTV